jgi:hypothetical protein
MKKIAFFYFSTLAIGTIILMFFDYNKHLYNQNNDFTGNPEKVLYYYPLLVIVELILIYLSLLLVEKKKHLFIKLLTCASWLVFTTLSFINSIHGGGVIAAHALWLAICSISIILILLIKQLKRNRQTL